MRLKKFFNQSNDDDDTVLTSDELQKQKIKLFKSIRRKAIIKKIILVIVLFFGVLGGYKALLSSGNNQTYDELKDQAFINNYLASYYSYPQSDDAKEFLKDFSFDDSCWKIDFTQEVEFLNTKEIVVYDVTLVDEINQIYDYYIKSIYDLKIKDEELTTKTVYNKVTIAKNKNSYLVIRPIINVENETTAISDKNFYVYEQKKGNESVDDSTKLEIENTLNLFLKTYNNDINQARLLVTYPDQLYPLDSNTKLELNSIQSTSKSKDSYYVDCTVNQICNEYKQIHKYHFEIDIEKNKINVMEVY